MNSAPILIRFGARVMVGVRVTKGPFKCYVTQWGMGGVSAFPEKKRYEVIQFNVISVTRGWMGVQFPEK